MQHLIKSNKTKKQKINPDIHSLSNENYPLIEFLYSRDIVDYVFSFIQVYHVILILVSKSWRVYFKDTYFRNIPLEELAGEIIKSNELNLLKWLQRNNNDSYIFNEYFGICAKAALNGRLDILKWAKETGCYLDKYTCSRAAFNGHLDCLQWARENGCPWDEDTCYVAASNGHLDCLQWARENGCPE